MMINKKSPKNLFTILLLFLVFFASCVRKTPLDSEALVLINKEPAISVGEFIKALARSKVNTLDDSVASDPVKYSEYKEKILNTMIRDQILLLEAKKAGITVTEEELQDEVDKIKEIYGGDLNKILQENSMDFEAFVRDQKKRLLIEKLVNQSVNTGVTISEAEVQAYFNTHYKGTEAPAQVRVFQIVVPRYSDAVDIKEKLARGENFSVLARKVSASPEGPRNGGDLGYISKGDYPPEFDVVFTLPVGQVSDIVSGDYGFHIFKVIDKRPAQKVNLADVRAKIKRELLDQNKEAALTKWMGEVATRYTVEKNMKLLEKIQ